MTLHELDFSTKNWWVAFNPLLGVIHVGKLESGQQLATGQLLLFNALGEQEVVDMVFESYEEYTEEELEDELLIPFFETENIKIKSGIEREILFSVYDSNSAVNPDVVIGAVNSLVPGMTIDKIAHQTDPAKFLVPFSQYAWDSMTAEEQAPLLAAKEAQDGLRKTVAELDLTEWVV